MFSLIPRSNALRNWPVSLGLLFVAAPLISPPAKAQTASLKPNNTGEADTPQLTDGMRPGSAIATPQRLSLKKRGVVNSRPLVMSVPEVKPATKPALIAAPVTVNLVSKGTVAPQPAAQVPVQAPVAPLQTTRSVATLAPPVMAPKVVAPIAPPVTAPKVVVARPATAPKPAVSERLTAIASLNPTPDWAKPTTRAKAANLPARGGLILKPNTVPVRPERAVVTAPPAVSEAQRLMLARLDADLAKAQRRLNRAESRLTEGQRQLGSFTGVLQHAMMDAGADARGLHPFVRVAQRYLGTPYVWGGESARGFDCSGFIMRVMRDLGYKALPHSAAEQFRYGMPVSRELLKAGDIVFFANTYKPGVSHVGIYLGRGRFIHAANSKDGTIVSGLNEPKWVEKYAGARRLVRVNS